MNLDMKIRKSTSASQRGMSCVYVGMFACFVMVRLSPFYVDELPNCVFG